MSANSASSCTPCSQGLNKALRTSHEQVCMSGRSSCIAHCPGKKLKHKAHVGEEFSTHRRIRTNGPRTRIEGRAFERPQETLAFRERPTSHQYVAKTCIGDTKWLLPRLAERMRPPICAGRHNEDLQWLPALQLGAHPLQTYCCRMLAPEVRPCSRRRAACSSRRATGAELPPSATNRRNSPLDRPKHTSP